MALSARSGTGFEDVLAAYVYTGSSWTQVGQVYVRDDSDQWATDGPIPPAQPSLSVVSEVPGSPPVLSLTPGTLGGATETYRLDEYRYDALGLNRSLSATLTGAWDPPSSVQQQMLTSPPAGTKISYELYGVAADGVTLSPVATLRYQIGTAAVTTQQAVYGWGSLSAWVRPNTYFSLTSQRPGTNSLTPLSFAYDSAGNGSYYENDTGGATQATALNDGSEILGNGLDLNSTPGTYPGTITMTWLNATTRRLDEVKVIYRGMVGLVTTAYGGVVSRGRSEWQLTGVPNGVLRTAYCDNPDPLGALRYTAGAVQWTGLSRERAAGTTVPIRCVKPPYYGQAFGVSYSKMAVFDMQVRVREWVITGYTTVIVTPAVPGSAW